MADAIGDRCRAAGVEIVTGDPVDRVVVRGGRACGVRLRSGLTIEAEHVVSGIHPKTLMGLVPDGALSEGYRAGILGLGETPGSFGVVALVDSERHRALEYNALRIRNAGGGRQEGVFAQIRPSTMPGYHRLVLLAHSDYDAWGRWRDTTLRKRGDEYEAQKRVEARRLMQIASEAIGPLHDPKLLDIWTPLTLRDYTGSVRGSIYGARHGLSDGIERMVLTRAPLPGLFMVGQNAIAPGLVGVALGALRVAGDIAGRPKFRRFLAERAGA
jgi:all-trans-retinol 13,14-reductase